MVFNILGLFRALVGNRAVRYIALVLAFAGAILTYGQIRYKQGAAEVRLEYEQLMEAERERLERINEEVLRRAQEQEQRMQEKIQVLDGTVERLQLEAMQDENSDRPALSPGSVSRINQVR